MSEDKCIRCGSCCVLSTGKPCRHLEVNEDGKTSCKVYETRIGRTIGYDRRNKLTCGSRETSRFDYVGCPYNTNKPMKDHREQVKKLWRDKYGRKE